MHKILTKRQFYELWDKGILGNKPKTWSSVDEFLESGFRDLVALRYRGPNTIGPFVPNLLIGRVESEIADLVSVGWSREHFNVAEQLTPGIVRYLINGEIIRSHRGLELYYGTENSLMRDSLRNSGKNIYGTVAIETLRHYLWQTDLEELLELLDDWPDHAIEFSGFDRPVGIYRKRTVIWEIRLY